MGREQLILSRCDTYLCNVCEIVVMPPAPKTKCSWGIVGLAIRRRGANSRA